METASELLLQDLDRLVAEVPAAPDGEIVHKRLASATAFSCRKVVLFGEIVPPRPLLALVLEGRKQVVRDGVQSVMGRGDVLVAPAGVPYHATTAPDSQTGWYRVFCTELDGEAAAAFARRHGALSVSAALGAFDPAQVHVLAAGPSVLQALRHFVDTLLLTRVHAALVQHRLEDLLLSLSVQHAEARRPDDDLRSLAVRDPVLAARQLIRAEPERPWPASVVARRLSMSETTLRRKLADGGQSLRALRTDERMGLAAVLMAQPDARVSEVSARCGYESPSKFARQFRRWFGHSPGERFGRKASRSGRAALAAQG